MDLHGKGIKGEKKRGRVQSAARSKAVVLKCHATVQSAFIAENKLVDNCSLRERFCCRGPHPSIGAHDSQK